MKKALIILGLVAALTLGILIYANAAKAGPFVICNDYPSTGTVPDYFSVVLDSAAAIQSPAYTVTNSQCIGAANPRDCCTGAAAGSCSGAIFHYDLSSVTVGSHTMSVAACNTTTGTVAGGCTSTVNFPFSVKIPGSGASGTPPASTRISGQ